MYWHADIMMLIHHIGKTLLIYIGNIFSLLDIEKHVVHFFSSELFPLNCLTH